MDYFSNMLNVTEPTIMDSFTIKRAITQCISNDYKLTVFILPGGGMPVYVIWGWHTFHPILLHLTFKIFLQTCYIFYVK